MEFASIQYLCQSKSFPSPNGSKPNNMQRQEVLAIKEAVSDFIAWTNAWQEKIGYPWWLPDMKHPGVNSPKINPDYEWLHRQTWIHEE